MNSLFMKAKTIPLDSEVFTRAVKDVVTREELQKKLSSGRQMRVKIGIDATAPDLHIGHAAPLWKIRALQEAGHKAVIILGEFTTRIGDPTGKSATRQELDSATIRTNIASLKKQVEKIIVTDPKRYELRKNSEWHGKMKSNEFLRLASFITHSRLIERDMFQERIRQGREITVAEMLYPLLQGYDSVAIQSDLTIIGSDQLFNEHFGRLFQEKFNQDPQCIVTVRILPGLDGGEKMSKSLGNYIGLNDSPTDKFGKAMRIQDSLIIPYFEAYTDVSIDRIRVIEKEFAKGMNPRDAKLEFAQALVHRYHGASTALGERERFVRVFSEGKTPQDAPEIRIRIGEWNPVDLLVSLGLASSKSQARRLILGGGIEADKRVIRDASSEIAVRPGMVVRAGKHRFVRIR
ncbi:MAG: tyrosine--tRNA ligase [Candidatus Sungbacteria bacterium]|nr:tyrosine--tRNA ligase [Candidatus Sungbacteria bacterium]